MIIKLEQSLTYVCRIGSTLDDYVLNLITLELVGFELGQPLIWECRLWSMLSLWMSSLVNLGPMSVDCEQSLFCECRTWSDLYLWVSSWITLGIMRAELNQSWLYEWRSLSSLSQYAITAGNATLETKRGGTCSWVVKSDRNKAGWDLFWRWCTPSGRSGTRPVHVWMAVAFLVSHWFPKLSCDVRAGGRQIYSQMYALLSRISTRLRMHIVCRICLSGWMTAVLIFYCLHAY